MHIATLGGLTASLNLQRVNGGIATLTLTATLNPGPINVAQMTLSATLTPSSGLVKFVPSPIELALKAQYNFVSISDSFSANQSNEDYATLERELETAVSIGSIVHRVREVEVIQSLGIDDGPANNLLTPIEVAQVLAFDYGFGADSVISLSQTLTYTATLFRSLTTNITIEQGLVGITDKIDCEIITGRPSLFKITELDTNTFVTMKFPIIGDTILVKSLTVDTSSRGGNSLAFVPPLMTQHLVRKLQFKNISNAKKEEFQTFVKQFLGVKMSILTPENTTVTGFIVNPEAEYTDNSKLKNADCVGGSQLWEFEILFLLEGKDV